MSNKKDLNEIEIREIIERFENLDDEGQKRVVKALIGERILTPYINTGRVAFGYNNIFVLEDSSDELTKKVTSACKVFDTLLDTMYGDDEELKNRIVLKFLENYKNTVKETKKEICGDEHQYSEWCVKIGKVPYYAREIEHLKDIASEGQCFERKCKYCGTVQKAYTEEQKNALEYTINLWKNKKLK